MKVQNISGWSHGCTVTSKCALDKTSVSATWETSVRPSVLPSVRVDWSEPESTQPTTTTMAMITMTTMTFFTNNPDLLYLNCFSYLFIPYCVASLCSCQIKQYPSLPQYAILFDLCLGAWPSNIRPSAKTMPSSYIITNKFHYATQCGIP